MPSDKKRAICVADGPLFCKGCPKPVFPILHIGRQTQPTALLTGGTFAPYKRFAAGKIGAGRIHFA